MGAQIILANNVITNSFPNIDHRAGRDAGQPGVFAQPNPPHFFSG